MRELPAPLTPLAAYPQFLNYKLVPRPGGKTDKLPVNPRTGVVCDAHDTGAHVTAAEAFATGLPVAFVFTEADPFFFLDIDDCRTGEAWTETANALCRTFAGCAVEVSQSGEGLHIFGIALEALEHGCNSIPLGSQFYTSGRFVALTGTSAVGDASHVVAPLTYRHFIATHFPPGATRSADVAWTSEPDTAWDGPTDDAELIARMRRSRSARGVLGGSATIVQLWDADEDALGKIFPDTAGEQGRAFDWSLADAALCSHLAFWTGKDCERMDTLFRQSALCRDKWLDREPYRTGTILNAVGLCSNVYRQKREPVDEVPAEGVKQGLQFLSANDQIELFKGCCYVQNLHRAFVPEGYLLKPEQFRAKFGGNVLCIDAHGTTTTRNAWEVFTESQAYEFPWAHTTCFRPELPPGEIIVHEGTRCVNTYVPVVTEATAGDPTPFLKLIDTLLPKATDKSIVLSYMAACVQHPGIKFQWAPLIQGVEGNGKSFIGSCLTHAIGEKYTHIPDPKDLGNIFNSWLCGKLLIVIEEVYTNGKADVVETLKWMVTNARVPIQAKGQDQITGDNRANFFMFSNHMDAVRKTESDRRTAVFYTAQQKPGDILASGMGGDYFPKLYAWAKEGGYAIVNQYLRDFKLRDELNPATLCHRAPTTTSTEDAILISRSAVEQEVAEATKEGRIGFSEGWISSIAFNRLLETRRVIVPMNKRREILEAIGYTPHPALTGGRVNNKIPMEQGKPRLYIKAGHLCANIEDAGTVSRKYQEAQGYITRPGGIVAAAGTG